MSFQNRNSQGLQSLRGFWSLRQPRSISWRCEEDCEFVVINFFELEIDGVVPAALTASGSFCAGMDFDEVLPDPVIHRVSC